MAYLEIPPSTRPGQNTEHENCRKSKSYLVPDAEHYEIKNNNKTSVFNRGNLRSNIYETKVDRGAAKADAICHRGRESLCGGYCRGYAACQIAFVAALTPQN